MNKPDAWMPWYIGDYLADTMHLRAAEHGAYLLLLAAYWRNGAPLNDADAALAAVARCTPAEWRRMRPTIAAFFDVRDGKWHHKRVDAELEAAQLRRDRAAAGGRAKSRASAPQAPIEQPASSPQASVEQCSNAAPLSSPSPISSPPSACARIIRAFDHARMEAFGVEQGRPWPHQTDAIEAQRWLSSGADEELIGAVLTAGMGRKKARGEGPPASLSYFTNQIADALAAKNRPMPQGQAPPVRAQESQLQAALAEIRRKTGT